ncbi:unnamed protein product [Symbiodinium sp. CCMP2456]|nr:unnamed protein product [Symbiodinium sp. CCMP2456]
MARSLAFVLVCAVSPADADWALLNLIRHAERYADKSITYLAPDGKDRAEYIARCATAKAPSLMFPRPPSALLAGKREELTGHNSTRPWETLHPLATKSGLRLDNHVDFQDVLGFKAYLKTLPSGSSVLVAWEHKMMGQLAQAVDPEGLAPAKYPDHCDSEWREPEYTMGACYDVIWQFVLYRSPGESWRAKAFSHLHMGFAGRGSKCAEAFEPFSNPGSWPLMEEGGVSMVAPGMIPACALGFCSLLFVLGRLHALLPVQTRGTRLGKEPLLEKSPSENYILVC